jgi:hypothetical protein
MFVAFMGGLKQGGALSLMVFNFSSEFTIKKVQESRQISGEWDLTSSGQC